MSTTSLIGISGKKYERRIVRAGFFGGFVAQWLWRLQSDTLAWSPTVAGFRFSPFFTSRLNSSQTFVYVRTYYYVGHNVV